MNKIASKLQPGDIIFYYGKEAMIEFIQNYGDTIHFRHTYAKETCQSNARFLVVNQKLWAIDEVERIVNRK